MFRKIKNKLLYSFSGILAGGTAVCLLMAALSLLLRGRALAPGDILRVYAVIAAGVTLFLAVCGVSLLRHEGFRPRNLMGVALGKAMYKARKEAGLTQKEMARKLRKKQSYISAVENGRKNITFATLARYAHACGKKIALL